MLFSIRKELKIILYRCDDCPYVQWFGWDKSYCSYGQEPDDPDLGKFIRQAGKDDEDIEIPNWCPLPGAKP